MNKYINNPIPTHSLRWRIAVVAVLLTALTVVAPWLTSVAYACQSQGGGC